MQTQENLRFLEDKWDDGVAGKLAPAELLRYRSNLLGSDLRITNFGGGNTSSKIEELDPLDGSKKSVLRIKGSGGDMGSIQDKGFATLYLEKLHALESRYRGVQHDAAKVRKLSDQVAIRPGSINPNIFQDQEYKYGSIGNPNAAIRKKALDHILECVKIADQLQCRDISPCSGKSWSAATRHLKPCCALCRLRTASI